jgi:hypothetical protein
VCAACHRDGNCRAEAADVEQRHCVEVAGLVAVSHLV